MINFIQGNNQSAFELWVRGQGFHNPTERDFGQCIQEPLHPVFLSATIMNIFSGPPGYEVGHLLKGPSSGGGSLLEDIASWDEIEIGGYGYIRNFLSGDSIEAILLIAQELRGKVYPTCLSSAGFLWSTEWLCSD